jgi:hypothetical protein
MGRRRGKRQPGFHIPGEPDQIPAHPLLNSFEAPAFRRCEILGHGHGAELDHGLGDLFEPMFEIGEVRRNGRRIPGPHRRERGIQYPLAVVAIGDPQGLNQQNRLPGGQPVFSAGGQHLVLVTVGQGRQMGGNRRAQPSIGHGFGGPG